MSSARPGSARPGDVVRRSGPGRRFGSPALLAVVTAALCVTAGCGAPANGNPTALKVNNPVTVPTQPPPVIPTDTPSPTPSATPTPTPPPASSGTSQSQASQANGNMSSTQGHTAPPPPPPAKAPPVTKTTPPPSSSKPKPAPAPKGGGGNGFTGGGGPVYGLDIAGSQIPHWTTAKAAGIRFAFIKATEGTYYVNSDFPTQYVGAYKAGIIRGAYAFGIPGNSSGAAQAAFLFKEGGKWSADGKTLPGTLDIEYNPYPQQYGNECYDFSQSQMRAWLLQFVDEYHALSSRWPIVYSTTDWWATCTGDWSGLSSNDPLWLAHYASAAGVLPTGYKTYTFWQYSSTSALAGLWPLDRDVFNGSPARLEALAKNT